jgi:hypothetical protein
MRVLSRKEGRYGTTRRGLGKGEGCVSVKGIRHSRQIKCGKVCGSVWPQAFPGKEREVDVGD